MQDTMQRVPHEILHLNLKIWAESENLDFCFAKVHLAKVHLAKSAGYHAVDWYAFRAVPVTYIVSFLASTKGPRS